MCAVLYKSAALCCVVIGALSIRSTALLIRSKSSSSFSPKRSRSSRRFSSSSSSSDEPMKTTHLKLGQVFSPTYDYIFSVTKNMRSYSWERGDVETLFLDLVESMDRDAQYEYELNQIIALKEKHNNNGMDIWEVADGQQRLITLCLLYCAMRDCLEEAHELRQEIQKFLVIKMFRKEEMYRMTVRSRHNEIMLQLLQGSKKIKKRGAPDLVQQRIADAYFQLCDLVKNEMNDDLEKAGEKGETPRSFIEDFFLYLSDYVFIYLTTPESYTVARRLVGNARKGQDADPIDELKAMVIFLGMADESVQDSYLLEWERLETEVERDVLQQSCLLMAQVETGRRSSRNDEVEILDEFWKLYADKGGENFFDCILKPGATLFYNFQNAIIDPSLQTSRQRLIFLHDLSIPKSNAKWPAAIKAAVLSFLLDVFTDRHETPQKRSDEYLDKYLAILERIGLLFATQSDDSPKSRFPRIFSFIADFRQGQPLERHDLTPIEKSKVLTALEEKKWGASPISRKVIRAVLRRLDAVLASESSDAVIDAKVLTVEHVLPEKPNASSQWCRNWTEEDRETWKDRFGNLININSKKNSSASNKDFSSKREIYSEIIFPLAQRISKKETWGLKEVKENHEYHLALSRVHFGWEAKN